MLLWLIYTEVEVHLTLAEFTEIGGGTEGDGIRTSSSPKRNKQCGGLQLCRTNFLMVKGLDGLGAGGNIVMTIHQDSTPLGDANLNSIYRG